MIDQRDRDLLTEILGREPRAVEEVLSYNIKGQPQVIRTKAVVDGKPFPTLYWLTCPILKLELDRIEATGIVKEIEDEVLTSDEEMLKSYKSDHQNYIDKRLKYIKNSDLDIDMENPMMASLKTRGIGGITKHNRVRCLHMQYAQHLVDGNTIGTFLDGKYNLTNTKLTKEQALAVK